MVTTENYSTRLNRADILLVTATEVETQAVLRMFSCTNSPVQKYTIGDNTYFDLGEIAGTWTVLVQSEMGSGGPGGAGLVVYDGIEHLSPSAVIMVGIAFGLKAEQQQLGDILVSQRLTGYELQKIGQGPDGAEIVGLRGDRVQASFRLLNRLRASNLDWQGSKVHFGLMLSGDKLVNNKDFRKKLLDIEPEAIGGEMEGTGVYAAAQRNKVDWILVKAISDWANGDKNDAYQQRAAEHAASFLLHVCKQGGLAQEDGDTSSAPFIRRGMPRPGRAQGTLLSTFSAHASWVLTVAWQPEGNKIASAGGDGVVRVWDADNAQTLLTYRGHAWLSEKVNWLPKIYKITWSPEGLRLASAGDGRKVYVWDATTGQTITIYEGHSGVMSNVYALAWSPDGKRIASACSSAGFDKTVHVWNAKTGSTFLRYNSSYGLLPNFSVLSATWSPRGDRVASTCGDKTIRLWDAATGKHLSTFKTRSEWVYTTAWSPDGSRLALAHKDSTAEIIDATTGQTLLLYEQHGASVRDIAWSPDGKWLATASNDSTVQIWNADTGERSYLYEGHAAQTTAVAWSPDGTRVASGSNDKTVQVWQAT